MPIWNIASANLADQTAANVAALEKYIGELRKFKENQTLALQSSLSGASEAAIEFAITSDVTYRLIINC